MADPNPFAPLTAITPGGLNAQRTAEFSRNPGDSFWAVAAGQSGLQARDQMLRQGIALSQEDERAINAQNIMQGAQKRLAQLVESGDMDPLDAQEIAINETMSAFMSAGDWEAAQSLVPGLNQIRTYRSELNLLRSEASENDADARNADAQSAKYGAEATALPLKTDAEVKKAEAEALRATEQAGTEASVRRKNEAQAGMYDRSPREGSGSKKSGFTIGEKAKEDIYKSQGAVLSLFGKLDRMSQMMDAAPRASSAAARGVSAGSQYLKGFQSLIAGSGGHMGGSEALSENAADGRNGTSPKAIFEANERRVEKAARSLNMDVDEFASLVIDTAYSLARVNDPGGRLSNNDFDFALKMLGAVQDAQSAKNSFKALADRAYADHKSKIGVLPDELVEELFRKGEGQIDGKRKEFVGKWGAKDPMSGPGRSPSVVAGRPAAVQEAIDRANASKGE